MSKGTAWSLSIGTLVLAIAASWMVRDVAGPTGAALLYVPAVLVAAGTGGGRLLGLVIACGAVLALNVVVQRPYGSLVVHAIDDGVALGVFVAVAAVTTLLVERVRETAALDEANRLKDTLLKAISHELRTPIATIKATAALRAEAGDVAALRIEREADRLSALVADLLDWSRLEGGVMAVRIEAQAVSALLDEAAGQLRAVAPTRPVRVDAPSELAMFADRALALRILHLLMTNADRYAPPATPITVSASEVRGLVHLEIADLGPGVSVADRERIFEPFQRASSVGDGQGLGLAIARALARAQGGDLVVSTRDGPGAVFTLTLPPATLPNS